MNSVYKPCQSTKLRNFINVAYIVCINVTYIVCISVAYIVDIRGPSGPKNKHTNILEAADKQAFLKNLRSINSGFYK